MVDPPLVGGRVEDCTEEEEMTVEVIGFEGAGDETESGRGGGVLVEGGVLALYATDCGR